MYVMIYQEGKLTNNTILIDAGLQGVKGISSLYYIESEGKTLLIDSGDSQGARRVIKKLRDRKKPLPDFILLTHAHWDHSQGVPDFRKKDSSVRVFASDKSIDLLKDQSFNDVFNRGKMKNIHDVDPLKEGEIIELGGMKFRCVGIPGHTFDHVGYYDETNKIMFAGDAIGIRVGDKAYIPPCMPPFWDENAYYATLDVLKQMDIETLCIAHFGYIPRIEIGHFIDEMRSFYDVSKRIMTQVINNPKLEPSLVKLIMEELNLEIPQMETFDKKIPILLGIVNLFRRIKGKNPIHVGHILTPTFVNHAFHGFKNSSK
jgi:glyoxylase-like metal-dependent hydrolase (beta-lactamase superfamily II)